MKMSSPPRINSDQAARPLFDVPVMHAVTVQREPVFRFDKGRVFSRERRGCQRAGANFRRPFTTPRDRAGQPRRPRLHANSSRTPPVGLNRHSVGVLLRPGREATGPSADAPREQESVRPRGADPGYRRRPSHSGEPPRRLPPHAPPGIPNRTHSRGTPPRPAGRDEPPPPRASDTPLLLHGGDPAGAPPLPCTQQRGTRPPPRNTRPRPLPPLSCSSICSTLSAHPPFPATGLAEHVSAGLQGNRYLALASSRIWPVRRLTSFDTGHAGSRRSLGPRETSAQYRRETAPRFAVPAALRPPAMARGKCPRLWGSPLRGQHTLVCSRGGRR